MDFSLLQQSMLFKDMTEREITSAVAELYGMQRTYDKGQRVLIAGDTTDKMGLVINGSVTIESNDIWGNRTILDHVGKLQFFAETYALLEDETLLVDVVANEPCTILFFRPGSIRELKDKNRSWVLKFMANLLTISSYKNLKLSGRSFHTSPKSIRGRVMAYLNSLAQRKHSSEFDIPFDRQQLADYLNVERTALSKELSKMQKEGLIWTRKKHFIITYLPLNFDKNK